MITESLPRYYGIYRGICVDNQDPEGRQRIRCQIPQLLGNSTTGWAWPCNRPGVLPPAPSIGMGVFVMFEGGDPEKPVWMGIF